MKRLLLVVITLLLLGSMGYFASQNSHSVSLNFFGSFTIQISVWMLIIGSFVLGWGVTELWHFVTHPERFVQNFLGKFYRYKNNKKQKLTQNFENASLMRDPKEVKKNFFKLDNEKTPLHIRMQYLEQLRYEESAEELLDKYANIRTKYQGNLNVLLPYLKLSCELKDWVLVERLSHEILRIKPGHPDALEGLRKFHISRQDWVACIEQERDLLTKYSGSLITKEITLKHEEHLQKALEQDPKCLKNWSFRYLHQKRDRKKDKSHEAIGKAKQLINSGMFIEGVRVLIDAYRKDPFFGLIMSMEKVYQESGSDEKILEMIGELHSSRQRSFPITLLFAKLLYQNSQINEASEVLNEVNLNEIKTKFPLTKIVKEEKNDQINQEWIDLYYALRFFVAISQNRWEDALEEAKPLLNEAKLLGIISG